MTTLYVIRTGRTTWEDQSRVESAAGAPLTEAGVAEIEAAARELAGNGIKAVYASRGEAERQTAGLLARALGAKVHTQARLCEIDYGLWQGLTVAEVQPRQPQVYQQWDEAPATVRPPGGESLQEAQQRLREALKPILKRHKDEVALVVLRPITLELLRCLLENRRLEDLWGHDDVSFLWDRYETGPQAMSDPDAHG